MVPRVSDYLDERYVPRGFIFRKPNHLRVNPCATLLKHLLERQVKNGVGPDVFAWKCFAQKTKEGVVPVAALISFDRDDDDDAALPPRPKPRTTRKGKKYQATPDEDDAADDSGMDTPPDCDWALFDATGAERVSPESESDDEEPDPLVPAPAFQLLSSTQPRINAVPAESDDDDEPESWAPTKSTSRKNRKLRLPDSDESDPGSRPSSPGREERRDASSGLPGAAEASGTGGTSFGVGEPSGVGEPASCDLGSTAAASGLGPVSPGDKHPGHDHRSTDEEEEPPVPAKRPRLEVSSSNVLRFPRVRKESQRLRDVAEAAPDKTTRKKSNPKKRKAEGVTTAPTAKAATNGKKPAAERPVRTRPPPRVK